jgi:VanZ family protein
VAWRWCRRAAPAVVAAVVLVASVSEPSPGGPPTPSPFGIPGDKLLHGGAYAALAAALGVGLATPGGWLLAAGAPLGARQRRLIVALAVLGAVGYGLAMEGVQYPLPFRTFDLLDAAANAVGAALGALAWLAGAGLRRRSGR